jgi:hypothetical protein
MARADKQDWPAKDLFLPEHHASADHQMPVGFARQGVEMLHSGDMVEGKLGSTGEPFEAAAEAADVVRDGRAQ